MKNYTKEQIEYKHQYTEELAHVFGYVNDPSVDNNTNFFDYSETGAKKESVEKLNYYKKLNEKAIKLREE